MVLFNCKTSYRYRYSSKGCQWVEKLKKEMCTH
uniref:Uncharacterized protein n=1 Tax=Anguilla anguilla TaxID=7936 RepID=A0A0E9TKQ0_ANGAN